MKQQEQKQADIVFGVEKRSFFEQQFHTFRGVGSLVHRWTFALLAPHEKHLIARLLQGQARLVDPLVRDQVVDYRYDGAFHADKDTKFSDETSNFAFYCVSLPP